MAIGYLPSPFAIFAPGANILNDAPSPIASCFLLLLLVWHILWMLLLGYSLKLSPFRLFCVCHRSRPRPLYRSLSASKSFLASPPQWASNITFHVGFWPACDRLPSDSCYLHSTFFPSSFFPVLLVSFLVFLLFPCCCLIFQFIPLFPCMFSFLFLLVIRFYSFSLIYLFLLWSKPWVVDVNNFLAFKLRMISFSMSILLSGPRNKRYVCIEWCLFGADLILNLMYSHRSVNAFGYGWLVWCWRL